MSVFLPEGYAEADQAYPVFVVFHGGAWRKGEPALHFPDCVYWAGRGMVAASVRYRLKDKDNVRVPLECVKDAKAAVCYLRANAEALKLDPDRIGAAGASAGGGSSRRPRPRSPIRGPTTTRRSRRCPSRRLRGWEPCRRDS